MSSDGSQGTYRPHAATHAWCKCLVNHHYHKMIAVDIDWYLYISLWPELTNNQTLEMIAVD